MPEERLNTTIADDFNYTAQSPLVGVPSGKWARMDTARNPLRSNGVAAIVGTSGTCYSYWTPLPMDGDDAQVWATAIGGGQSGQQWGLTLSRQQGGASQADGYHIRMNIRVANGTDLFLERFTNMGFKTLLSTPGTPNPKPSANGGQIWLLRRRGTLIEFLFSGDGGANWTQSHSIADTTYTTGLYGGLELAGTAVNWDNFGVGPADFLPQMSRRRSTVRLPS